MHVMVAVVDVVEDDDEGVVKSVEVGAVVDVGAGVGLGFVGGIVPNVVVDLEKKSVMVFAMNVERSSEADEVKSDVVDVVEQTERVVVDIVLE